MKKGKENKAVNPEVIYIPAIRAFIRDTIQDQKFFSLSPEEQKKIAMEYLKKHKQQIKEQEEH